MNWNQRATDKEELDDLNFSGKALNKSLDELSWVHRHLGGHFITIRTLKHALRTSNFDSRRKLKILDAGCGGGDSLRSMAKWARKQGIELEFFGIDGNPATIDYARQQSVGFPEIQYHSANLFSDDIDWKKFDIVMFALVLHHFKDEEILNLLTECAKVRVPMICINDLHRHPLAYYLFAALSRIIGFSRISREDGLISIQKAFTKDEIRRLLVQAGYKENKVSWQWAFRYEAIAQLNP